MNDDERKRAEERHAADLKSTAPASKGYVTRSVDALAAATARALKDELGRVRAAADSTELLLADLDERVAAIEARLLELEK